MVLMFPLFDTQLNHQGLASRVNKHGQSTGNPSGPAAILWQDGAVSHNQLKKRMNLEILFDLIAADVCQASVVFVQLPRCRPWTL